MEKKICWQWGDNTFFRNYVNYDPITGSGFVYFTNSANGLTITEDIINILYNRISPSCLWLGKLQYNNPTLINLYKIYSTFLIEDVEKGLSEFKKWKSEIISDDDKDKKIQLLLYLFKPDLIKENKKFVNAIENEW